MAPFVWFVLGGAVGYGVSQARKKKTTKALPPGPQPLMLGPACSTWEIVDHDRVNLLVRKAYVDGRLNGVADPYKLTDAAIRMVAPKCHTPKSTIRNMGELDLYTSFFDSMMGLLWEDQLYSQEDFVSIQTQFQGWHGQQVERLGI